jgi:methanogenic corrinoid protein MtbC1
VRAIEVVEKLRKSILDLEMDAAIDAVHSIVSGGTVTPQQAVDAISGALAVVGRRFQEGEWFLGELVYAAEITKASMELIGPLLGEGAKEKLGTIVVGTVAGDLHDLGKNIFGNYATSAGFEVIDLGVDVSAEAFAAAAEQHTPMVLGMSCLLTTCAGGIGAVIEELTRRGIRKQLRVIIGGAALTEEFAGQVGADAFASDAVTGTDIVKEWTGA